MSRSTRVLPRSEDLLTLQEIELAQAKQELENEVCPSFLQLMKDMDVGSGTERTYECGCKKGNTQQ
jgi:hypothetical protein